MKVLHIYDKMPVETEKYIAVLSNKLKDKFFLKTLTFENNNDVDYNVISYGFLDNIQRIRYKLSFSKFKSLDIKIMNDFDIVHIQYSFLYQKFLPLLKIAKRPKTVITFRGSETFVKPWISKEWANFYKNNANHIDAIVVMSQAQKKYLEKWGILSTNIFVISPSFGSKSSALPKYPNKGVMKIISAFRMTWEKNIEGTIRFAKTLKHNGILFEYDIYGDGNDLGQLYYLVDKFSLTDCVKIKGEIPNIELKKKLIDYDFYLQLSISESLSASVIEAQSLGLPCIVSDSDGIKETILPNITGICAPYYELEYFASEIVKLWNDKDKYFSFSKNAIAFANENFSLETEIEKTMKMYKSLTK